MSTYLSFRLPFQKENTWDGLGKRKGQKELGINTTENFNLYKLIQIKFMN